MVKKEAVIETIKRVLFDYTESNPESLPDIASANKLLCKAINALPGDDGWVPVEERMPELFVDEAFDVANSNPVLVTVTDCFGGTGTRIGELAKNLKNGRVNWLGLNSVLREKVIAWQPLPSPYAPPEQRTKLPRAWIERTMSEFERVE